MMDQTIFAEIDRYLEASLLQEDDTLAAIASASEAAGLVPHAVSALQAAFLAMMVQLSGARRVLEIGCLGGYSAVAMARALPQDGRLITTEIDTRTAAIAKGNIERSGYGDRIELRVGPAVDTLHGLIEAGAIFDLVFIDADKVNHKTYLDLSLKLTRQRALIIADNVVREGGVLRADSTENSIQGVRAMFDYARTLEGVEMTALQTIGAKGHDGMALFRVR